MSKRRVLIIAAITVAIGVGIAIGIALFPGGIRQRAATRVLRAGFIDEFITRKDGYLGLIQNYGLKFPFRPEPFDPGEVFQQLTDLRVDVISGHSTSASMRGDTLVALKDDKNSFLPPYEAAPLVRRQTLASHPELKTILGSLAGQILEKQMRELNYQAEIRGRNAAEVARDFLVSHKLIEPSDIPGDGSAGTITVGAKNFAENEILAELMAILIEHNSNLKVLRKLNLGTTATVFGLIREGQIDLYAEYTGTGVNILGGLNREDIQDPDKAFETVRREFAHEYELEWLERFGFSNEWTLVMRSEDARKLGFESISDLARRLLEQSERGVPTLPAETPAPKEEVKAPSTPEQIRIDLEGKLQPAREGGRMSKKQEERFKAQYDLVSAEIKLGSMLKDVTSQLLQAVEASKESKNDRRAKDRTDGLLFQAAKAANESKKEARKARERAEPFRVSVDETEQALINQFQFVVESTDTITPIEAFRWVAITEELLHRVEVLKVSLWDAARNESGGHLGLLEQLKKGGANPDNLKAFRSETEQTHKEITTLKQYAERAAWQLDQVKKQESLARDQLDASEACLKLEPKRVNPAKPRSTVDEFKLEAKRLEAVAQCDEKEAGVLRREARLAEELVAGKRKEKENLEWDLEFERRKLEKLQEDGAAEDEIHASRKRVDALKGSLDALQEGLAPLEPLAQKLELRARVARLHAGSVRKDANEAKIRLDKEKRRLRNRTISSWVIASLLAVITIGLAWVVSRLVRKQELASLRGVRDPEKAKRIDTPYLLIRRIAVPLICIVGGLLVLIQFEMFQRIGLTIFASAGVMSLVVGLSARDLLGNTMSGIMLCFSQPIRVGDTVKMENEYGTIEDIGLLHTTLRVWDNRRVVLPNKVLVGKEIVNYSLRDQRIWTKVPISLDYAADVKKAREILIDVAKNSKNWNGQDEPVVWFMELGEQTITLWVAAWADDPNKAWGLSCDILDNALQRFQEEGIPLPRRRFQIDRRQEKKGGS